MAVTIIGSFVIWLLGMAKFKSDSFGDLIVSFDGKYNNSTNRGTWTMLCLLIFLVTSLVRIGTTLPGYSEGVRVAKLEKVSKKGRMFKTWEATSIKMGFQASEDGMKRELWKFSLTDEKLAKDLSKCSGKTIEFTYEQSYWNSWQIAKTSYIVTDFKIVTNR